MSVTVRVYDTVSPGRKYAGPAFVIARSTLAGTATEMVATLLVAPWLSCTVYVTLLVPVVNPGAGVNVTFPALSTVNVPFPGSVNVVCRPGAAGSRSTVAASTVPGAVSVSFPVTLNVTLTPGSVLLASFTATGGRFTGIVYVAAALVAPLSSVTVYWKVALPLKAGLGVNVRLAGAQLLGTLAIAVPLHDRVPMAAVGRVVTVYVTTVPSASVPLRPGVRLTAPAVLVTTAFVTFAATGGWFVTVTLRVAALLTLPAVSFTV